MSATNLYLYPKWAKGDAGVWKKVLSVLVTRQIISPTGEGSEEGEIWFSPGKRADHLLKGHPKEAFEDCRVHNGNAYFIPDGDTGGFGAKCACGAELEDAVVATAIADHNEADAEDDRQNCPKCGSLIDVPKLTYKIPTAMAPSFLCFVSAASGDADPELLKGLQEATGCAWGAVTEKVEV